MYPPPKTRSSGVWRWAVCPSALQGGAPGGAGHGVGHTPIAATDVVRVESVETAAGWVTVTLAVTEMAGWRRGPDTMGQGRGERCACQSARRRCIVAQATARMAQPLRRCLGCTHHQKPVVQEFGDGQCTRPLSRVVHRAGQGGALGHAPVGCLLLVVASPAFRRGKRGRDRSEARDN